MILGYNQICNILICIVLFITTVYCEDIRDGDVKVSETLGSLILYSTRYALICGFLICYFVYLKDNDRIQGLFSFISTTVAIYILFPEWAQTYYSYSVIPEIERKASIISRLLGLLYDWVDIMNSSALYNFICKIIISILVTSPNHKPKNEVASKSSRSNSRKFTFISCAKFIGFELFKIIVIVFVIALLSSFDFGIKSFLPIWELATAFSLISLTFFSISVHLGLQHPSDIIVSYKKSHSSIIAAVIFFTTIILFSYHRSLLSQISEYLYS